MLQRRYSDGVVLGVGVGVVDALPAPVPVGVAACCVTDAVSDALGVSDAPAPRERHERLPMGDALGCGDARGVAVGDGDGMPEHIGEGVAVCVALGVGAGVAVVLARRRARP